MVNLSEGLDRRVEHGLAFGADRHRRSPGEDFQTSSTPALRFGRLGPTDVNELGVRVGPACAGVVAMDLEWGKATAFIRFAIAVDQNPSRVSLVLLLLWVSKNFRQGVFGHRGTRVVDRIGAELSDLAQARLLLLLRCTCAEA